jgi:sec-independent protein translocase protein TatA
MLPNMKGWEWLIIVALILLLFGAKRLPDAARGLGRSLRIFKAETKGLAGDSSSDADEASIAPAAPAAAPPVAAAPQPVEISAPKAEEPAERTEG